MNKLVVLSLGAGVQSSTLALMATAGSVTPLPDAAIFADTQDEPVAVYAWLTWLEKQLSFPVYRVTAGSLMEANLVIKTSKKSGKRYLRTLVPFYIRNSDNTKGALWRKCTRDYKIQPIIKQLRKLRKNKKQLIEQWIGISTDEAQRMKPSKDKWITHRWPLIEAGMSRADCLAWMKKHDYPTPPRSACVYCPYHSDKEWARIKRDDPEGFAKAVRFEQSSQLLQGCQDALEGIPYLHPSLQPLSKINFDSLKDESPDLFGNECEGICGV